MSTVSNWVIPKGGCTQIWKKMKEIKFKEREVKKSGEEEGGTWHSCLVDGPPLPSRKNSLTLCEGVTG
jgi:hypothetical protein